tara:strand:+ start:127 stop:687 length:561 start_codon:yes stop_codon:yes gene_type:complete
MSIQPLSSLFTRYSIYLATLVCIASFCGCGNDQLSLETGLIEGRKMQKDCEEAIKQAAGLGKEAETAFNLAMETCSYQSLLTSVKKYPEILRKSPQRSWTWFIFDKQGKAFPKTQNPIPDGDVFLKRWCHSIFYPNGFPEAEICGAVGWPKTYRKMIKTDEGDHTVLHILPVDDSNGVPNYYQQDP